MPSCSSASLLPTRLKSASPQPACPVGWVAVLPVEYAKRLAKLWGGLDEHQGLGFRV